MATTLHVNDSTLAQGASCPIDPMSSSCIPGPQSQQLLDRLQAVIGRTNYVGLYGIGLSRGEGNFIIDMDGNRYLDGLAAASCNILGYGHPEIADEYWRMAKRLQQSCFPYSPNEPAVSLAEHLVAIVPGSFPKKVLLGLSGSDACDGAIEAMRRYTGRVGLINFKNDYHGSTGLSQAASGFRDLNEGILPPSPDFIRLEYPVTPTSADRVLVDIETYLQRGNVGGVMAEPIQGDAGILVPAVGFFPRLAELLHQYGALLILDEVQSGMGRTGHWWAIEHEGVDPDLLISAKGLSGGYAPISAVIGRQDVIDSLNPAQHLFTYTGHPPSCAAASKVIEWIKNHQVIENARQIGAYLLEHLEQLSLRYPDLLVQIRGRGLMIGVEIGVTRDPRLCQLFAMRCVERGVYLGYFGINRNVIRIEPPLVISRTEADLILTVIEQVAHEIDVEEVPQSTVEKVMRFSVGL